VIGLNNVSEMGLRNRDRVGCKNGKELKTNVIFLTPPGALTYHVRLVLDTYADRTLKYRWNCPIFLGTHLPSTHAHTLLTHTLGSLWGITPCSTRFVPYWDSNPGWCAPRRETLPPRYARVHKTNVILIHDLRPRGATAKPHYEKIELPVYSHGEWVLYGEKNHPYQSE
jgi:hypothetical protein